MRSFSLLGGECPFTQRIVFDIFRLRAQIIVGVGACERYGVVVCACGTWSVFQALAHIRHAFEKNRLFLPNGTICAWWVQHLFRSTPTPKMCQDANYLSKEPYYALIRPLDRIL